MEEVFMIQSTRDPMELHQNTGKKQLNIEDLMHKPHTLDLLEETSSEISKKVYESSKHNVITPKGAAIGGAPKIKLEIKSATESNVNEIRSTLSKTTRNSSSRASESIPLSRRSSTGGLPMSITKRQTSDDSLASGKRTSPLASDILRKSLPEILRSPVPFINVKHATRPDITETRKSIPISTVAETPRTSSDSSKQDSSKKTSVRSSPSSVSSSVKRIASPLLASTGSSSSVKKSVTKVSSVSTLSPSVSSGFKSGSLSTSLDKSSSLSGCKKLGTPESRDSLLIMLPQVDARAGNDRMDLHGHRIRNLNTGKLNLSPNLEFVYLRDNLLSTLDGIEVLKWVKVLDLSFNDFKGPDFEPLENCIALQQLDLAGNQISSLKSPAS